MDGEHPTRAALADALRRLRRAGIALDGASAVGISEALYLRDPDGDGLELYRDRPRTEWPVDAEGNLAMARRRLDLDDLLAAYEHGAEEREAVSDRVMLERLQPIP